MSEGCVVAPPRTAEEIFNTALAVNGQMKILPEPEFDEEKYIVSITYVCSHQCGRVEKIAASRIRLKSRKDMMIRKGLIDAILQSDTI